MHGPMFGRLRTNVARILDNVVVALGPERFLGCSKDLQVGANA